MTESERTPETKHSAPHKHAPDSPTAGKWEVCACGATREAPTRERPAGGAWHTCKLCTHAFGLS